MRPASTSLEIFLFRKCPTSFQLVDVFLSRPRPEASTSWQLVGHCAARFSFFQGAATGMKAPAENQPRRNEEHEGISEKTFALFVSSWLILILFRASLIITWRSIRSG